jgi:hypothetical protein
VTYDLEVDLSTSPAVRYCSVPVRVNVLRRQRATRGRLLAGPRIWDPKLPREPLRKIIRILGLHTGSELSNALRTAASAVDTKASWASEERATLLTLADLSALGWHFSVVRSTIYLVPRSVDQLSPTDAKHLLRRSLLEARALQLESAGTKKFFAEVCSPKFHEGRPVGIEDLIDDGKSLAEALRKNRDGDLASVVDPYLQYVSTDHDCPHTGLNLMWIWRFFRHTWSLEWRPTPGRSLNFLIRNAARPGHPVMGIIGLANAVFQLGCRDHTIGWTQERTLLSIIADTDYWSLWRREAIRCLKKAKDDIRSDDLIKDIGKSQSTAAMISKLMSLSQDAGEERKRLLRKDYEDGNTIVTAAKALPKNADGKIDWKAASARPLFRRKRAEVLADIIFAIDVLETLDDDPTQFLKAACLQFLHPSQSPVTVVAEPSGSNQERPELRKFLSHVQGETEWKPAVKWTDDRIERAFKIGVREIKKNGVSTRIFDVNVCGASPVYRDLLGGKLAAMMLFSEEIQETYRKRYQHEASEIASSMAGRPITKPARICALTTTSLYGVGSSQYNRVRMGDRQWERIGYTEGFGTVHMTRPTIEAIRNLAITSKKMRNVNNQFGEGTSPLLRQLREGLTILGFEPNDVLQHSNRRIAYMLELYAGAYADLCLDADNHMVSPSTEDVAAAWRDRWLRMRVKNDEILDRVAAVTPQAVMAELGILAPATVGPPP